MERTKPAPQQTRAQQAIESIKARKPTHEPVRGLLPSGSTLLNLALSDHYESGIGAGKVVNIIGDSSAGKTLLCLTAFAEMAYDSKYDDYELILDDVEQANEFSLAHLFGKKTAERVMAPVYSKTGAPLHSKTVEQFYSNVMRLIESDRKFVYVLDSLDALSDAGEYEIAQKLVKEADKLIAQGDQESVDSVSLPGTYGMQKPKLMSQILRNIVADIANSSSVLIIISQTRANIGAMAFQPTKRRAGGEALEFYCSSVIWLSRVKTIKAGKEKAQQVVGHEIEAKVSKNKLTGKRRVVRFCTYDSYGVDDMGSCVDFLAEQGVLKKKGGYLDCSALGESFSSKNWLRKELLNTIEEEGKETIDQLRRLCWETWQEVEETLELGRKPRFDDD